ncbi:MAG: tetratricopeptide repeat protein [Myxococcota bacterium]
MDQTESGAPADAQHRRGLLLLEEGQGAEAFAELSQAYLAEPQNARYRSAYALALALVRGQFIGAVELARSSIRQEFHNPDLYLNLARIYLHFEFKAEAIRFLRRGLMVDPSNAELQARLAELGIRRRPPLPFLPRAHGVNRLLGRIHARLVRPKASWGPTPLPGA